MNPYDFVVAEGTREEVKKRPAGHDLFTGNSGIIHCRMITEGPLFIANGEEKPTSEEHKKLEFFTSEGKPAIPGSSLKGMTRSVAEAVADSCMVLCSGSYRHSRIKDKNTEFQIPRTLKSCTSIDHLCITCRMFGMMQQNDPKSKLKSQKLSLFKGKASFSDGKLLNNDFELMPWQIVPELSSPKPQHRPFYESDHRVRGRKFYYHQASLSNFKTKRNVSIQPIQNAIFGFEVNFQNLTDEEFELLLYSLVLEPGMRHKIGMGKPLGLGSVRIGVEEVEILNIAERYSSLEGGVTGYEGEKLGEFMETQLKKFRESQNSNMVTLRRIWQWPPLKEEFGYPGYNWFKDNPGISLEEYNQQTAEKNSPEQVNKEQSRPAYQQCPGLGQTNDQLRREAAAGRDFKDRKSQTERSHSGSPVRTFGEINSMSQIRIISKDDGAKKK